MSFVQWAQMKKMKKTRPSERGVRSVATAPLRLRDPAEALQQSDQDAPPTWPRSLSLKTGWMNGQIIATSSFLPLKSNSLPSQSVGVESPTKSLSQGESPSLMRFLSDTVRCGLCRFFLHPFGTCGSPSDNFIFLSAISAPAASAGGRPHLDFATRANAAQVQTLNSAVVFAPSDYSRYALCEPGIEAECELRQKSSYIWLSKRLHFSLQGSRATRSSNTACLMLGKLRKCVRG